MSKRKREKMKSKEKRHEKAQPSEASKMTLKTMQPQESKAFESNGDLFPHLKDASPEWQQFYRAVSKAVE